MGADIFFRCLVGFEGRWRCAGHPVFPVNLPDKVPLRPCGAGHCPELAYAFLPHHSRFAVSEPVKAARQRLTFFLYQGTLQEPERRCKRGKGRTRALCVFRTGAGCPGSRFA